MEGDQISVYYWADSEGDANIYSSSYYYNIHLFYIIYCKNINVKK